jgi:hypothetical protein
MYMQYTFYRFIVNIRLSYRTFLMTLIYKQ